MASVTMYFNRKKLGEKELTSSKSRVGRHPSADVFLPHRSVSRLHALLLRNGRSWELHDPGGTNGLFVNGARVKDRRTLANGDRIQVAQYTLIFDTGDIDPMALVEQMTASGKVVEAGKHDPNYVPKADGTERFDKTMELSMLEARVQQQRTRMRERAHLQWTSASGETAIVPLGSSAITIGSAEYCRVTIPKAFWTGKTHAIIAPREGEWVLQRASWWTRSHVNGKVAPARYVLQDRDRVMVAKREKIVFFDKLFTE